MPRSKQSLTLRDKALPTLIYHDIFDYPLTEEELLKWEVGSVNVDGEVGSEISGAWRFALKKTGRHFHLKGRSAIVKLRLEREKESAKKLKLARKISTKLSTISTIRFIGVTGSLAMNNAKRESDIDLMIITSDRTLWITRVMVKIVSWLNGFTVREPARSKEKDAICFNLWLDSQHLVIPKKMRNLYSAHEVLQVVPLCNKDHIFEKFLDANKWALAFWPKAKIINIDYLLSNIEDNHKYYLINITYYLTRFFEPLAYWLQRLYMNRHITRELVEPGRAFFHPVDWSSIIIRKFNKRIGTS